MRYLMMGGLMLSFLGSLMVQAASFSELEQRVAKSDATVLTDIEALLREDPKHYPLQFLKARLLQQQGKTEAAIAQYQQLIKQYPAQPEPYNNLASILAQHGDIAGAQKLLEQAIKTNSSYAAVYENLSNLYVEQARDAYGKALRLEQNKKSLVLAEVSKLPNSSNIELTANKPTVIASNTATATTAVIPPQPATTAPPAPVIAVNHTAIPPTVRETLTKPNPKQTVTESDQWVTLLQGWAAAWAGKTPDLYLSYYGKNYAPSGVSRTEWESQRRERIVAPQWIKVDLSEFRFKNLSSSRVRARFVQDYQSDDYHDRIRKEVVLDKTPDGWRIVAERKVAVLR